MCIEPTIASLNWKPLSHDTSNSEDGAHLDVSAQGFWGDGHHQGNICRGVPRPLKAHELGHIFNYWYGNVCYAGIDIDPEKYPKGCGCVSFASYRKMQLTPAYRCQNQRSYDQQEVEHGSFTPLVFFPHQEEWGNVLP